MHDDIVTHEEGVEQQEADASAPVHISGLSEADEVMQKREVNEEIAQELRQQEESYTE